MRHALPVCLCVSGVVGSGGGVFLRSSLDVVLLCLSVQTPLGHRFKPFQLKVSLFHTLEPL